MSVEMPAPEPNASHATDPLPTDGGRKHRTEAIPSEPYLLLANVGAALKQQVLHIAQAQREAHVLMTTSRITSGDELKQRNRLKGLRGRDIGTR